MNKKPSPCQTPMAWKPLKPKNSSEVYFEGTQKKRPFPKIKSKPLYPMSNQLEKRGESPSVDNAWSPNRVKEIFPQLKNKQEFSDACCEEVKVLSLKDLKIHTKMVTKKEPDEGKPWNATDFPSVEIGAGVHSGSNATVPKPPLARIKSFSMQLKENRKISASNFSSTGNEEKYFVSTSCQTDPSFIIHSNLDANLKYLCSSLPPDLKNIFLNYVIQQDELKRVLLHLLKTFSDSYNGKISLQDSSIPLRTVLSPCEKEFILSQIF